MAQALKRGLFGYRTGSVKSILADREQMFAQATKDIELARSRNEELAGELDTIRTDLMTAGTELDAARTELEAGQAARDALEADLETVRTERDTANAERTTLLSELVSARTERDAARKQLTERERLLEEATARATSLAADVEGARTRERQEAERARSTSAELASARRDLAEANAKVRTLERAVEQRGAGPAAGEAEPAVTTPGDLDRVLLETQTTIDRIVSEARRGAERELAEIERRRETVRAEVEALLARRDRLAPLAENVRHLLSVAQTRTEEADARLRSVLEPLATTVGELKGGLIELMDEAEREEAVGLEDDEPADEGPSAVIHLADGPRIARSPW